MLLFSLLAVSTTLLSTTLVAPGRPAIRPNTLNLPKPGEFTNYFDVDKLNWIRLRELKQACSAAAAHRVSVFSLPLYSPPYMPAQKP